MDPNQREPLRMEIELTVIEDLGFKLYTQLPAVMAEIVANSWDADAHYVKITVPVGTVDGGSLITIEDDGFGMNYDEIQEKYLKVGRKKREEEGTEKTPAGRTVMGRKGIGKLSVFGVAKLVEIATTKNHIMTTFLMNIDDILHDARSKGSYEPMVKVLEECVQLESGTIVRLTHLKRKTPVDLDAVGRELARHFSVIGNDFRVSLNGKDLSPADKFRKLRYAVFMEFQGRSY